ncbi:MAG: flagellar basal body rod protein FlgC [Pseudomonadota bacterium]
MSEFSNSLSVISSALQAQSQRLRHLSENIANVDTPGYRRKTIAFHTVMHGSETPGMVETGRVRLDQSDLLQIYDPTHPMADEAGNYEGSNVNLMIELSDAREAQRSYEANLRMFEQTRQMGSSLFDLLRR